MCPRIRFLPFLFVVGVKPWALSIKLTVTSLVVFGKTYVISAARTFLASFQEFWLLLLHGIFSNINVLRKLRFLKSSISSKNILISLSWSANFLFCSADLKFKLSTSSLFCFNSSIASSALFSTSLIVICKSAWTASNLFSPALSFTYRHCVITICNSKICVKI